MAIQTFKRYECKYMLTEYACRGIMKALPQYMEPDAYCKNGQTYSIYNIYFDTADNAVIRGCLQKPYYKEKLRLRSYTAPQSNNDRVFLELKKKIGGIVSKRRAGMTYGQALTFTGQGLPPQSDSYEDRQVSAEIADFLGRYPVRPAVVLSYERTAFFGREYPELRISFDHNIRSRRKNLDLLAGGGGSLLLPEGCVLMEVKCLGALPLWLCSLFSRFDVRRTSFSKYGTEYIAAQTPPPSPVLGI